MATLKIVVRRENGEVRVNRQGKTLIFVQYVHEGKALMFSTGIKIEPAFIKFNHKDVDQRNPLRKTLPGFSTKNSNIQKLVQRIDEIKDRLINQDIIPNAVQVKNIFEEKYAVRAQPVNDFFTLFDQFILDCKATKAWNTTKQYITCVNLDVPVILTTLCRFNVTTFRQSKLTTPCRFKLTT
ncbi:MAG TPA: hypothetical protein VK750_04860 [Cytophagaceae bacterium]|nr:hypothetical protein [Cytophagaceae bacterium]